MRSASGPGTFDDLVDWAITWQNRAGRLLFLAICLGTATGLFIALFQVDAWKQALLIWAWEEGHAGVIRAIADGSWGLTWQQWGALGAGITALFLAGWYLPNLSVARKMRAVAGLRAAVRAERERRTQEAFVLVGCLLALLLLPFAIAWGASHHDDFDDD